MSQYNVHEQLTQVVLAGMKKQDMTQTQLAHRSGVAQGNLSAIFKGKPASEATWQKLFDAAWP